MSKENIPEARRAEPAAFWPMVGDFPIYDDFLYDLMSTDTIRNRAFCEALAVLAPERKVIDIGAGRDLNWTFESLRAGAAHVFAIEASTDSARQARKTLARSQFSDRVTIINKTSTEVLPSEAFGDLCVSETLGELAGSEGAASILGDCRRRLLEPGAPVIPARAETLAAPVELPLPLTELPRFATDALPYIGAIFDHADSLFDFRLAIENFPIENLLASPVTSERVVFNPSVTEEQNIAGTFEISRNGRFDGILMWLRFQTLDGEPWVDALSNRTNWNPVFIPLPAHSVCTVDKANSISCTFRTTRSSDGLHRDYAIEGTIKVCSRRSKTPFSCFAPHIGTGFRDSPIHSRLFLPSGQPTQTA